MSEAGELLSIGDVARRSGRTASSIRYYEEIGLLPGGSRIKGTHRLYDDNDVERLAELTRLRDLLNLSLEELKELVEAEEARAVLRQRLNETDSDAERVQIIEAALPYIDRQLDLVRRQKAELERLESELVEKRKRGLRRLRELSP